MVHPSELCFSMGSFVDFHEALKESWSLSLTHWVLWGLGRMRRVEICRMAQLAAWATWNLCRPALVMQRHRERGKGQSCKSQHASARGIRTHWESGLGEEGLECCTGDREGAKASYKENLVWQCKAIVLAFGQRQEKPDYIAYFRILFLFHWK